MADEKIKAAIFNANDSMEGFEDINGSTMAIPFVRVLQKLSPQLNKQKPEYIDGAEEGDWYNNTTKEVYGPEINVIVLKFERVFIEWKPNRGGFVGYHTPENAERLALDTTFGNWKTKEGHELAETYVYMALIEGHEQEGLVVLSFASSAIKVGKEWNRLMTTHVMDDGQRARPYYLVWKLTSDYKENDKGSWYVPKVKFLRYISEKQYALAGDERKALPSKKVDYAQIEGKSDSIDSTEY
jgi:hypothetical protein